MSHTHTHLIMVACYLVTGSSQVSRQDPDEWQSGGLYTHAHMLEKVTCFQVGVLEAEKIL